MTQEIRFKSIGIIHSPYKEPEGTPIQPSAGKDIEGSVEVFREYADALKDLDGFSHIILIYYFQQIGEKQLEVKPFMDDKIHGIFATRAPNRPNPIGISVVRLTGIKGTILLIQDLDIIDGTPLLDIKPYVPEFDHRDVIKTGWLETRIRKLSGSKDDGRFTR